jgi:hypothetical protein
MSGFILVNALASLLALQTNLWGIFVVLWSAFCKWNNEMWVDFIHTIDDQDKMFWAFMRKAYKGGKS